MARGRGTGRRASSTDATVGYEAELWEIAEARTVIPLLTSWDFSTVAVANGPMPAKTCGGGFKHEQRKAKTGGTYAAQEG